MIDIRKTIIFILFTVSPCVIAQSLPDDLDAVTVSPDLYHVLFENEHVRVVQYEIKPGQIEKWHTHPAKVAYVLSGGSLKITTENGDSFSVEEEAGAVRWLGAVGRHYGENIGETVVRIVFAEIKGLQDNDEDINAYLKKETENKR